MKNFFKVSSIFFLPVFLWVLIVFLLDPFNYFNKVNIVTPESKREIAERLNPLIYETIDCVNNPCENMLVGDSRTRSLPLDEIEKISGNKYKKLVTDAAKLNEIFEMIYFANSQKKLKHLVIGVNFSQFNKYGYADRIGGVIEMTKNPLMYIFNRNIAETNFYLLKFILTGQNINTKPSGTKEEFWKWNVRVKAAQWYGKYKFPENLYSDLKKLDSFSVTNNIKLTLIIVPHNREFHDRLVEFGLSDEEKKFKQILSTLSAEVIDYDYENSITSDKENYNDPIHYDHKVGTLIVDEVWNKKYVIGKVISKNYRY